MGNQRQLTCQHGTVAGAGGGADGQRRRPAGHGPAGLGGIPMNGSECLVIEKVRKTMGAVRALAGVSLTVPRGTVHGIIGHNGSGKSTLIKILAGVLPPDEGSYLIVDGRARQGNDARAPRVAAVF